MLRMKFTNGRLLLNLALPLTLTAGFGTAMAGTASADGLTAAPLMVAEIPSKCFGCGVISDMTHVSETRKKKKRNTGLGAVTGAVIGGVVGHNVGHGDSATIGGAVVGGVVGNQVEKHNSGETIRAGEPYYRVEISMDGGGVQTINLHSVQGLAIGQRVRVDNGNIVTQ